MGPRRVRYAAASGVLSMRNVACHPRPMVTWLRSFGWLVRFLSVPPPFPLICLSLSSRLVSSSLVSLFRALALSLSLSKPPLPRFSLSLSLCLFFSPFFCLVFPKILFVARCTRSHHLHLSSGRVRSRTKDCSFLPLSLSLIFVRATMYYKNYDNIVSYIIFL